MDWSFRHTELKIFYILILFVVVPASHKKLEMAQEAIPVPKFIGFFSQNIWKSGAIGANAGWLQNPRQYGATSSKHCINLRTRMFIVS